MVRLELVREYGQAGSGANPSDGNGTNRNARPHPAHPEEPADHPWDPRTLWGEHRTAPLWSVRTPSTWDARTITRVPETSLLYPTFRSLGKRFFAYKRMHVLPVLQDMRDTKMRIFRTYMCMTCFCYFVKTSKTGNTCTSSSFSHYSEKR
jgi:hypothetical protein